MAPEGVIRVRDADSSERRPLLPLPHANLGFTEKGRYLFEPPAAGWVLRVDDAPLDQSADGLAWVWEPGFFAGEVTAEAIGPDGLTTGLFLLDVAPDPRKAGRGVFARMLEELYEEDPALVFGAEPGTRAIGELGVTQNPWLEFARFRRYAPDFLRAIVPVIARPRTVLRMRRAAVPLHLARRVDRHTGAGLFRSAALTDFFASIEPAGTPVVEGLLDVPITEQTLDAAANRALLALVLALLRRSQALEVTLDALVRAEPRSETRTPLAPRWPARLQFLRHTTVALKRVLRHRMFVSVRRPEVTAAALTAIAADPVYSRAWGRGWRALRTGVDGETGADRLWVSPSWQIYERWCFTRLRRMLAASLSGWHWRRAALDWWVGTSPVQSIELRLQPTFRSLPHAVGSMLSISRQREPDIVFIADDERGRRFVVLDAKYRTSRENVLDAMASAHIYQDSLRMGGRRPEASLLLVPAAGGAPWLEQHEFQVEHRVGVHPFAPGDEASLPGVIASMLSVA